MPALMFLTCNLMFDVFDGNLWKFAFRRKSDVFDKILMRIMKKDYEKLNSPNSLSVGKQLWKCGNFQKKRKRSSPKPKQTVEIDVIF